MIDDKHVDPTSPQEIFLPVVPSWIPFVVPFPESFKTIAAPSRFQIFYEEQDTVIPIGILDFLFTPAPPLTEDRISAIQSDPRSAKSIKMFLGCSKCSENISVYSGLSKSDKLEKEGAIWYKEIPDQFVCRCAATKIDLRILRENMHALLGEHVFSDQESISFSSLYEAKTLEAISDKFYRLLGRNPEENEVQTFLEETPIIFHRFSPARILKKPPLFNKYAADFAVLSRSGELFLIEIEKPSKKLLKKDGSRSSDFNHANDQVLDWLHVIQDHRPACLEMMGIQNDRVTAVRGVMIIGRDGNCDRTLLRKLKSMNLGSVSFLTYDDLLAGLEALIMELGEV